MKKPALWFVMAPVLAMAFVAPVLAQDDIIRIFPLRYHHAESATTWVEHLGTAEGRKIAATIGGYFGISPSIMDQSISGLQGRETERKGGIRRGEMNVPKGYVYCTTFKVGTQSQSDRAKFALFLSPDKGLLKWNSSVHKHGGVGGRTEFVERDYDVVFVKKDSFKDYADDGKCDRLTQVTKHNEPIIYIQHDGFKLQGDNTRRDPK